MVNNYDRIFAEINKEARLLASKTELDADRIVALTMDIVDVVNRHQLRPIYNINQEIKKRIETASRNLPANL